MHEIDSSFKSSKERSAALRRKRRLVRMGSIAAVLVTAGAGVGAWLLPFGSSDPPPQSAAIEPVVTEEERPAPAFVPALLDLAGDPLRISIGQDAGGTPKIRTMPKPDDLPDGRVTDTIEVLSDRMIASSERFMTTLPSSPQDFAFFQAQGARGGAAAGGDAAAAEPEAQPGTGAGPSGGLIETDAVDADTPVEEEDTGEDASEVLVPVETQDDFAGSAPAVQPVIEEDASGFDAGNAGAELNSDSDTDLSPPPPDGSATPQALDARDTAPGSENAASGADGGGWGETVDHSGEAGPAFEKTAIEDTTSVAVVTREADRFTPDEDVLVRTPSAQPVDRIIQENGFSAEDATAGAAAVKALIGMETVEPGYVVAMRGHREGARGAPMQLMQLSLYREETFIGAIARSDAGDFVEGADPWIKDDLFFYTRQAEANSQPKREYRLLDALYSTATRNGVPTAVIGETIMLMSRSFDLQRFATADDRLTIIYSRAARDPQRNGRVLYAAIRSPDKSYECFVYQAKAGGPFSCLSEKDQQQTVTVTNGMLTPVNGVLTSTFGPRKHPILKEVRLHKGVDWAAPIGTPVMAAFDGKVTFAGDGKDYGNFIRIDHGGGKATGYAHLSRFEAGIAPGMKVTAGEVIGYVGTTGRSTGPHLHFEMYRAGVAIDPLGGAGGTGGGGAAVASDDSAVEKLVNRIVAVESGGNARAKNPLSTASGLGQFIESTWIRMMKTYRPDLAQSLSREALLELRFDPTLAREMVGNLAREGESYLRSRGHSITAGRLYLAHFLGPGGAATILSAPSDAQIVVVLGEGVVKANPFLTGKDAAFVIDWAERKMKGKGVAAASVTSKKVVRASPEFLKYQAAMTRVVQEVASAL